MNKTEWRARREGTIGAKGRPVLRLSKRNRLGGSVNGKKHVNVEMSRPPAVLRY